MSMGIRNLVLGGAALAAAAGLTACGESAALDAGTGAEHASVSVRSLEILVEATGELEPIRIVEVKSKASGEVLAMHVETGEVVERGALLAEVDPRDVRNAYAQAEADLEVARARLAVAESRSRRTAGLQEANVATEQELEAALLEEANARAQLVKAEVALQLARERLGDVTIRAPLSGTVIQRDVEAGQIIASASQNISGGTTLLLMADLSEMQVRTLVDETDIGRINPGQAAVVSVDAFPDRTFQGQILKIEPRAVIEQNVTMFPVLIHLDNREGLLKPGMTAQVRVEIARRENVVAVPNSAIVATRDMAAAAQLLGLDEEAVRTAMRPRPAAPAANGAGETGEAEAALAQDGGAPTPEECMAAFQRMREEGGPGSLGEEDRARLQQCREAMGGGRVMARSAGMGGGARTVSRFTAEARPALVFVQGANGVEPRRVVLGVSDWDHTEVIEGLEPGERVILMSIARMQQQQQQMMDRVRQRTNIFPSTQQGQGQQRQAQPGGGRP